MQTFISTSDMRRRFWSAYARRRFRLRTLVQQTRTLLRQAFAKS